MSIDGNATGREMSALSRGGQKSAPGADRRFLLVLAGYGLAMVALLLFAHLVGGTDYVGPDNDDAMRLVEVRDLLSGQGWFDMMQYRLGLEGGTLMHWSRFIDLPIALLIRFFGLFAGAQAAEALALAVWPLSLSFVIVVLMGLAGRRAGGSVVMHVAAGMAICYVYGMGRFMPGSADHHNAQLTLATLLVAMLLDPARRNFSFALAGFAAAMEIAIGAEAVPFVAAACVVVAGLWAFHGAAMRGPAIAFSLVLVLTVTAAFFLTVPPHLYRMVTCDNLSLGFYSLASIGGFLLFLSALVASDRSLLVRLGALAATGVVVIASARIIAPQCLGNPLASLDPMLTELWLGKVIEAHSVVTQWREYPTSIGGFYGVACLAFLVCLWRILSNSRRELHVILLVLLGVSLGVASMQVRGTMFSNLLAILPMAMLVADLRQWQQAAPGNIARNLIYLATAVLSLPLVWSVAGLAIDKGWNGLVAQMEKPKVAGPMACASAKSLAPLATLPKGVVLAPSDFGVGILRYSPHRVLSAPYHRNQGGMLTELNTGLAMPDEAIAFLRGAKVDYVLFCPGELQTKDLAARKPDGFYAALMQGRVPPYLVPLNQPPAGGLQIYRVTR